MILFGIIFALPLALVIKTRLKCNGCSKAKIQKRFVKQAAKNSSLMFVPLAGYLAKHITQGIKYTLDPANASRTLLFNSTEMEWDDELLSRIDEEEEKEKLLTWWTYFCG